MSLGVNSYFINGNTTQTDGSDMRPDGSLGLWLHHQKYYIGLASNHIFQNKLQPLNEAFILKRTYQLNTAYVLLNKNN